MTTTVAARGKNNNASLTTHHGTEPRPSEKGDEDNNNQSTDSPPLRICHFPDEEDDEDRVGETRSAFAEEIVRFSHLIIHHVSPAYCYCSWGYEPHNYDHRHTSRATAAARDQLNCRAYRVIENCSGTGTRTLLTATLCRTPPPPHGRPMRNRLCNIYGRHVVTIIEVVTRTEIRMANNKARNLRPFPFRPGMARAVYDVPRSFHAEVKLMPAKVTCAGVLCTRDATGEAIHSGCMCLVVVGVIREFPQLFTGFNGFSCDHLSGLH